MMQNICKACLTLIVLIRIAADDMLFCFSQKIRQDISCELSAGEFASNNNVREKRKISLLFG